MIIADPRFQHDAVSLSQPAIAIASTKYTNSQIAEEAKAPAHLDPIWFPSTSCIRKF